MDLKELREILKLSPLYTEEELEKAVRRLVEEITTADEQFECDISKCGEVYGG